MSDNSRSAKSTSVVFQWRDVPRTFSNPFVHFCFFCGKWRNFAIDTNLFECWGGLLREKHLKRCWNSECSTWAAAKRKSKMLSIHVGVDVWDREKMIFVCKVIHFDEMDTIRRSFSCWYFEQNKLFSIMYSSFSFALFHDPDGFYFNRRENKWIWVANNY